MEEAESKWNQLGHGGDGGPQGCVFETLAVFPDLFMLAAFLSEFVLHKAFSSLTQAETIISLQLSLFTGTEGEKRIERIHESHKPRSNTKSERDCQHPKEPTGRAGMHAYWQTCSRQICKREELLRTSGTVSKILLLSESNCAWTQASNWSRTTGGQLVILTPVRQCDACKSQVPQDVVFHVGKMLSSMWALF